MVALEKKSTAVRHLYTLTICNRIKIKVQKNEKYKKQFICRNNNKSDLHGRQIYTKNGGHTITIHRY